MYILYVDDSGTADDPDERYFVLGAVAVFERGLFHQIKAADDCVASFGLGGDPQDIELHASAMYHGRDGIWRTIRQKPTREAYVQKALTTLHGQAAVRLFAAIADKAALTPRDPVAWAFEELCNRFNLFLARNNDRKDNNQRGLIVMDESKHEKPLQMLARKFRVDGARWGHFRNLAEVPLFVDSKSSRMIQLADLVAWSTFRKYEFKDGRFFDPIIRLFDANAGVIHGLVHYHDRTEECYCPACTSRVRRDGAAKATVRTVVTESVVEMPLPIARKID
jgi:hypothetical protein